MAELDTERLLDFIQRIINNSPDEQTATLRLKQLLSIMKNMQGVQIKDVEMLEETVFNISYLKTEPEIWSSTPLTKKGLEIAQRRARERRNREELAADTGRC